MLALDKAIEYRFFLRIREYSSARPPMKSKAGTSGNGRARAKALASTRCACVVGWKSSQKMYSFGLEQEMKPVVVRVRQLSCMLAKP